MSYLLFDPIQARSFGANYFNGQNYSYRFLKKVRFGFTSIYIPFGPVAADFSGLQNFIKATQKLKLTKVKIDLPLIIDVELKNKVVKMFKDNGFKTSNYIQDETTLILSKSSFNGFQSKTRYYIRKASEHFTVKPIKEFSEDYLNQIYNIYLQHSQAVNYKPKPRICFEEYMRAGLVFAAFQDDKIAGYLLPVFSERLNSDGSSSKVMQVLFSNVSEYAREFFCGYALYSFAIEHAFSELSVDYIDLFGASTTKNRDYLKFKKYFSEQFLDLPGSFEKTILF